LANVVVVVVQQASVLGGTDSQKKCMHIKRCCGWKTNYAEMQNKKVLKMTKKIEGFAEVEDLPDGTVKIVFDT
jgi:hypothetical protein